MTNVDGRLINGGNVHFSSVQWHIHKLSSHTHTHTNVSLGATKSSIVDDVDDANDDEGRHDSITIG